MSTQFGMDRRRFFGVSGGLAMSAALAAYSSVAGPAAAQGAVDEELRSAVRGRVLLPGDAEFAQAQLPWNRAVDQSVLGVVEIADADDAAALVRYARRAGVAVSTQPSGHGAAPGVNGTILVRPAQLGEARVDPDARSARVGPGVTWAQVQQQAGPHQLTGLAGSSAAINVVGFSLGGGLPWFGRKFGWAANSVTAFDIVDADGNQVRVAADSEPDLFWALRGGGGDFALVTAVEFDLHPAPAVYGGQMLWPAQLAPQVLAAFRDVTASAPDELTVWVQLMQISVLPPMVYVYATFLGDQAEGQALLRPFDQIGWRVQDTRAMISVASLGDILAEPTTPSTTISRAAPLTGIDDNVIEHLTATSLAPLTAVQIRHFGGAFTRGGDTAAGALTEPYQIDFLSLATDAEAVNTCVQGHLSALGPNLGSRTPFTFLSPGRGAADAFPADTLNRLREIKRKRDPSNVFRSNYPVLS
ncbi:FAD-binding oxidoreductase [Nocardia sp. NBC_00511]|uniref:FAD-binding oxidoreductase n=1 Tax=Nocardia sp. NBC_00511 TaxID=2903591 RepID=UPI0030E4600C